MALFASKKLELLLLCVLMLWLNSVGGRPVLDLARTATAYRFDENGEQLTMDLTEVTRLVAPCRTVPGRWCLEDIPSERLSCPAVLLDFREFVGRNSSVSIGKDLLEEVLLKAAKGLKIKDTQERVLLLFTGYKEDWNKDESATSDGTGKNAGAGGSTGPVLGAEAAQWLAENYTALNIVGIGTDGTTMGGPEAMQALAEKNLFAIEALRNLESLPSAVGGRTAGNSLLVALPVKLAKAGVGPVRVLVVPAPPPEVDSRASGGAELHLIVLLLSVSASLVLKRSNSCL